MNGAPARAAGALWGAAQWIVAPGYRARLVRILRSHFDTSRPGRWLDVGCGPRSIVREALPGIVVGVDRDRAALHRVNATGFHPVCGTACALPFPAQTFDGVVCFGLLHHLDDDEAAPALAEMRRVARAGATILVFDAVRPRVPWRIPVAALLRAVDRGRHVRSEPALRRLLADSGFSAHATVRYAWTGLEGCLATAAGSDSVNATGA